MIAYGIGPGKLADGLTAEALSAGKPENVVSAEQAKEIINGFKQRAYPRLAAWFTEVAEEYEKFGFKDLPGGYRRRHQGWFGDDARAASLRSCQNTVIQGTSAWMMKQGALRVLDRLEVMQVLGEISFFQINMIIHDQMIVKFKAEEAMLGLKVVEEEMSADLFGVPIPVEGHLARSYSKGEEKWFKKVLKPALEELGPDVVFARNLDTLGQDAPSPAEPQAEQTRDDRETGSDYFDDLFSEIEEEEFLEIA
ncbi:hypothetical protein IHN63_00245 [Deinococcus sp. 6YEL10]|uniref:DNA polymerase n=1 Tax=Deinococcus sp. 6YEL10 TaxID=2745870 RepID=UPI001E4E5C65|nr:hypothetical protein [Deinococcus sp. 6YEL10]